jgi:hypothetical protein
MKLIRTVSAWNVGVFITPSTVYGVRSTLYELRLGTLACILTLISVIELLFLDLNRYCFAVFDFSIPRRRSEKAPGSLEGEPVKMVSSFQKLSIAPHTTQASTII